MAMWLKLIGSAKSPISEGPQDHIGFRKRSKPSIQAGDNLFLYACGHKRVFALVKTVSDPEPDANFDDSIEGSCRWKIRIEYDINVFPSGVPAGDISSRLTKSLRQQSHVKLTPEESESAETKLRIREMTVCFQTANDVKLPSQPSRILQHISRIIRDTAVSRKLKIRYNHTCQLCGTRLMINGFPYCETHHIKPLGRPHDGSDEEDNLLCVCPNCHVLLDYTSIPIPENLTPLKHRIAASNINYHNNLHRDATSKQQLAP